MKPDALRLQTKAKEGLLLAVELFNRPSDTARHCGAIISLDHSVEMLLKAILVERGKVIFIKNQGTTISMEKCIALCNSSMNSPLVTDAEATTFRGLHGVRGDAQHYFMDETEAFLAYLMRNGVAAFSEVWKRAFGDPIENHLPTRVIPISTEPIIDFATMFAHDVSRARELLAASATKQKIGRQILRKWTMLYFAAQGHSIELPVGAAQFNWMETAIQSDNGAAEVLEVFSSGNIPESEAGQQLAVHLTKGDGLAAYITTEPSDAGIVMATREVDLRGRYPFSQRDLTKRLASELSGVNQYDVQAAIARLEIKENNQAYHAFRFGKSTHGQYSQKALMLIRDLLKEEGREAVRQWYKEQRRTKP